MIQSQIIIKIFDNSGIKSVKCISIDKKPYQGFGKVGVSFTGVVINLSSKKKSFKVKFKKGSIVKCFFFCSTKENQFKSSGFFIKHLKQNGAIVISKISKPFELVPLASRFDGYLPLTCYKKNLFFISNFNKTILLFMFRYPYYSQYFIKKKIKSQNLGLKKKAAYIKKIYIQISFKNTFFKTYNFLPYFRFIFSFLFNQKVIAGFSKQDVSFWSLRKTNIVSLYVTLRGKNLLIFLEKIVIFYFPKIIIFNKKKIFSYNNFISFHISDFVFFNEISTELFKIQESKILGITIQVIFVFNSNDHQSKLNFLRNLKIPFYLLCINFL